MMQKTNPIEAIFFDLDGVLIDSENHWLEVGNQLVQRWVPEWAENDHPKVMGLSGEVLYKLLTSDYGLETTIDEFLTDFDASIESIYLEKAQLIPGAIELLQDIGENSRTAIVTSSNRRNLDIIVDRFNLDAHFEQMISVSDFSCLAKPSPEIYLQAAKCLNVQVAGCLTIEDSTVGVQSAHAAGMTVFGLHNGFNHSQDLSLAHYKLDGFKGVTLETLKTCFANNVT